MNGWEVVAVAVGALFTTAVVFFASFRVPQWRVMERTTFLPDFKRTINVADKVQPALLVVTIISTAMLSSSVDGSGEVFGWVATTGFVSILLGSLVYLVPLQRRMIRTGSDPAVPIPEMRSRWIKGHLTRTAVALASFALLAIAVFVSA
jgi:hypothetical protein